MATLPPGPNLHSIPTESGYCPPPSTAGTARWRASFDHLGHVYTSACIRYVFGLIAPRDGGDRALETAKEVTQSFFARAMATGSLAAKGRDIRSFRAWIQKQLRDHYVDRVRHDTAQRNRPENGFQPQQVLVQLPAPEVLEAAEFDFDEGALCIALREAIRRLDSGEVSRKHGPLHAEIIRDLQITSGAGSADLAGRLGIDQSALARHKHAARKKLSRLLRDEIEQIVEGSEEFDDLWARVRKFVLWQSPD